jgi:hypothetical protein
MSTDSPRLSILIPNFNNGRQSTRDKQTDLIGDLMQSLYDTLGAILRRWRSSLTTMARPTTASKRCAAGRTRSGWTDDLSWN